MSSPTLGTLTLQQVSETGFDYPQRGQVVQLLGSNPDAGLNAVVQSSAKSFRQATISWIADDLADTDTARGYYEDVTQVAYTDHYGNVHSVVLLAFTATGLAVNRWTCQATLVETA